MPHSLSHKYPIPISQLCLVNTDVPAGVGAPPLDTTASNQEIPQRRQVCVKKLIVLEMKILVSQEDNTMRWGSSLI